MARIRSIKPEFPQSESMGRVSRDARLCFVLLWTIADDEGRLRGNSRMLASLLFPYDDDAPSLMDGWIAELEREGCVNRYQVDGATYIEIAKWLSHQKIDKPSKSKIAPFDEASRVFAKPREVSCEDLRIKDQGSKDQGEEGKGEERAESSSLVAVAPQSSSGSSPKQVKEPKPAKASYGLAFLIEQGCDKTSAAGWLEVRRKKKAPLTEAAWIGFCNDAERAGITPAQAVDVSARRSWAGFNRAWLSPGDLESMGITPQPGALVGGSSAKNDRDDEARRHLGIFDGETIDA